MPSEAETKHTPGPWPWKYTGDWKRIVVGEGLVEGPNGYEVAEVYSDDCPREVAEANARLIAAAPDLLAALQRLAQFQRDACERAGADALFALLDINVDIARAAIAKATATTRPAEQGAA